MSQRRWWPWALALGVLILVIALIGGLSGGLSRLEKIRHAQAKAVAKCPKAPADKVVRSNVVIRDGKIHALRHGAPLVSHSLGGCAPASVDAALKKGARAPPKGLVRHGELGCDLSNNDPQTTAFFGMRQNGLTYCWLKTVEGVGFHDHTAGFMRYWADRAGIAVGGYDFAHVCLVSASQEADFFAAELRADGLTGIANRLRPVLDAEYGGSGCSTVAWVNAWIGEMHNRGFADVGIYSGCWWWNPHAGRWWPGNGVFPWISGYPRAFPCSNNAIVVHQFTDAGNLGGGARGDENVLLGDPGQITAGSPAPPPPPPPPAQIVYDCQIIAKYGGRPWAYGHWRTAIHHYSVRTQGWGCKPKPHQVRAQKLPPVAPQLVYIRCFDLNLDLSGRAHPAGEVKRLRTYIDGAGFACNAGRAHRKGTA